MPEQITARPPSAPDKKQDTPSNPFKPKKPIGRRALLGLVPKTVAAVAGVNLLNVLAGCAPAEESNKTSTAVASPTKKTEAPTATPAPAPTAVSTVQPSLTATPVPIKAVEAATPLTKKTYVGNIEFTLDKDGLPISYKTQDGKEIQIDRARLELLRQKAIKSGETEVFDLIQNPSNPTEQKLVTSKEHPVLKDLPKDVLSTDELKKKGVEIIQADNTQLYIRAGAFNPDGPLADYTQGKYKLQIVLLDGPLVSSGYMKDARYDKVRDALAKYKGGGTVDLEKYRQQQIKEIQESLDSSRKQRDELKLKNPESAKALEETINLFKIHLFDYQHKTNQELVDEMALDDIRNAMGLYLTPRVETEGKAVIFLAVGENKTYSERILISVKSNGKIEIRNMVSMVGTTKGTTPDENQSFPDPANFSRDPTASPDKPWTYPYRGQSSGFALRHEIKHDELISGFERNDEYKKFNIDGKFDNEAYIKAEIATRSEYRTDEEAMLDIGKAWRKWVNSGYTDDSGYCFIFKLAGGRGYILTEGKQTSSSV